MANKTETLAYEIGDKISEQLGMTLVDARYKKEGGKWILRLFVDKEGGTGIDDCEAFSRSFETEFDKLDPIEGEYTLEVSSPGVDRELKTEREFLHYLGREVDVKLYKAISRDKEFCGVLSEYTDGNVTVMCGENPLKIKVDEAAYIKLHFEF